MTAEPTKTPDTQPWTPLRVQSELGLQMTKRGMPDFRNAVPKRPVPKSEAAANGWSAYFDGSSSCAYGHIAARDVSNPAQCSDCLRQKKGLPPIYPRAAHQTFRKPGAGRPRKNATATLSDGTAVLLAAPSSAAAGPPTIDGRDEKLLASIAECGSLAAGAAAVKTSVAAIEARRAANPIFSDALGKLEERLQIRRVLPAPGTFTWSPEIERKLINLWIDSGSLSAARDSCGISASQYFQHLEDSEEFREAIEKAAPLAKAAIQERVTQIALGGNPQLLAKFVPAQEPDDNPDSRLTDGQLHEKLMQHLIWCFQRVPGMLLELLTRMKIRPEDTVSAEFIERATPPIDHAADLM